MFNRNICEINIWKYDNLFGDLSFEMVIQYWTKDVNNLHVSVTALTKAFLVKWHYLKVNENNIFAVFFSSPRQSQADFMIDIYLQCQYRHVNVV